MNYFYFYINQLHTLAWPDPLIPVGAAVRAQQIGEAMLEVTARTDEFENGDKLGTGTILRYSDAYRHRQ